MAARDADEIPAWMPALLVAAADHAQGVVRGLSDSSLTALEGAIRNARGDSSTLLGLCERHATSIALNAVDSVALAEAAIDDLDIQPMHVYACAALIALQELSPAMSAIEALECQALAFEAMFMSGRGSMREETLKSEARRRAENARKGAARQKFTDAQMLEQRTAWINRAGHARGWMKSAANELSVTERAIADRWKEFQSLDE